MPGASHRKVPAAQNASITTPAIVNRSMLPSRRKRVIDAVEHRSYYSAHIPYGTKRSIF
jgi:hypothetical protein